MIRSAELHKFLTSEGLKRDWIAGKCRLSKRTVEGWFRREYIPEPAGILVEKIIAEYMNPKLQLKMSYQDFVKYQSVMNSTGYDDFEEFVIACLNEVANRELESWKKILSKPPRIPVPTILAKRKR